MERDGDVWGICTARSSDLQAGAHASRVERNLEIFFERVLSSENAILGEAWTAVLGEAGPRFCQGGIELNRSGVVKAVCTASSWFPAELSTFARTGVGITPASVAQDTRKNIGKTVSTCTAIPETASRSQSFVTERIGYCKW